MRNFREYSNDPYEIGICAGCGHPIYSNDNYWLDGDEMIHADGVGAMATVIDKPGTITISCLMLYLENICMQDEVAEAMGIEKKKAYEED